MKKLLYLTVIMAAAAALSCTRMDDYLKYAADSDRIYTGKLDTAMFLAGKERVRFYGELSSDPKVSRIGIFWTSGTENNELMIDVEYEPGKIIEQDMDLPEGTYNFTVYTYDSEGHSSIPTSVSGASYGTIYQNSLYNRVVKSSEVIDGSIVIDWYSVSEDSPYSEVTYETADGQMRTVEVPSDETRTTLENARTNMFDVRTYYLPEETAIDKFAPESKKCYARSDVTTVYLKNAYPKIERAGKSASDFDDPKDWNITDNVRNRENNTVGGWGTEDGGRMQFKTDGGGSMFENGKVWQTVTLPAGSYDFTVKYCRANTDWDKVVLDLVVAEGTGLPDHIVAEGDTQGQITEPVIVYRHLKEADGGDKEATVSFTIEQETQLSLGLVVTLNTGSQNINFEYFKLVQTN